MKKMVYIGIAWAMAAGCATVATTTDLNVPQTDWPTVRHVELVVFGLSCPLCSNNLDGRLKRIRGVENVGIDLQTGQVRVQLAEGHGASSWTLAEAVESAGFTLKEIRPGAYP